MDYEEKLEKVISQLRSRGYRITEQRRLLLRLILGSEYSSCKEIYFAAEEGGCRVGIATVYRTIQLLEDLDFIQKKWLYELEELREE